jgi:restriction system protein
MKKNEALPMHVQFFKPILDSLRELGGSATTTELKDKLVDKLNISEEELEGKLKSGVYRIDNQISWSKVYLSRSKLVEVSDSGVWSLTEKGFKEEPGDDDVLSIFKEIHGSLIAKRGNRKTDAARRNEEVLHQPRTNGQEEAEKETPLALEIEPELDWKQRVLGSILAMPPEAFERLSQRILRESGFTQVEVTGRSGDGGIDGKGVLRIGGLVNFQVVFQSKRYAGTVSAGIVRDFRGAMIGRADKGLIISTGTFSRDSRAEAIRDGAPAIDLVDGQELAELLKKYQLGVKTVMVEKVEVDVDWFKTV